MESNGWLSTGADASEDDLIEAIIGSLGRILLAGGVKSQQVRSIIERVTLHDRGSEDGRLRGVVHLGSLQRCCMEVMCHWRRDPEFCGSDGLPARIPFEGSKGSFVSLCAKLPSPLSARDVLELLTAFDAVTVSASGMIEARTPTFILSGHSLGAAIAFDGVLKQLLGYLRVIEFNVYAQRPFVRPRFERSCSVVLPAKMIPLAERFVRERGQDFIDSVDEWLMRQSSKNIVEPGACGVEVGAGAYFLDLGKVHP